MKQSSLYPYYIKVLICPEAYKKTFITQPPTKENVPELFQPIQKCNTLMTVDTQ